MSANEPEPGRAWRPPADPPPHPGRGGYHPPPGYQSGAQPAPVPDQPWVPPAPLPYPPPHTPPADMPGPSGRATTALAVGLVLTVLGCTTNIIGVVFAAVAMNETVDRERAERMLRYSWISTWVHVGLVGLLVVFFLVMMLLMLGFVSAA